MSEVDFDELLEIRFEITVSTADWLQVDTSLSHVGGNTGHEHYIATQYRGPRRVSAFPAASAVRGRLAGLAGRLAGAAGATLTLHRTATLQDIEEAPGETAPGHFSSPASQQ